MATVPEGLMLDPAADVVEQVLASFTAWKRSTVTVAGQAPSEAL